MLPERRGIGNDQRYLGTRIDEWYEVISLPTFLTGDWQSENKYEQYWKSSLCIANQNPVLVFVNIASGHKSDARKKTQRIRSNGQCCLLAKATLKFLTSCSFLCLCMLVGLLWAAAAEAAKAPAALRDIHCPIRYRYFSPHWATCGNK